MVNWPSQLRLRRRILIGYLIPMIVGFGIAGWTYYDLVSNMDDVEQQYRIDVLDHMLLESALQTEAAFRGYVITGEKEFLDSLSNGRKAFNETIAELRNVGSDSFRIQQLAQMNDLIMNEVRPSHDRIIELRRPDTPDAQKKALDAVEADQERQSADQFEQAVESLRAAREQRLRTAEQNAQQARSTVLLGVMLGPIAGLILSVVAALFVSSRAAASIDAAVHSVSTAAADIASTVERQEQFAKGLAETVRKVAESIEELDDSSRESAEHAERVATHSGRVLDFSEDGTATVKQTLKGITGLKEKVAAITGQIQRLSEQATQIGLITNFVRDVANQTNMLALNAAVEAARAGEHSKGFSVVAVEIRKLADQSKQSAERISRLVADVLQAIDTTVKVTEEGARTAEESTQLVNRTAETFTGVASSISSGFEETQKISANARHQATSIGRIAEAMSSVNTGAQETSAGLGATKSRVEILREAAKNLRAIV